MAHLEEVALARANLREADLRGTRREGAHLAGADLRGAYLARADLRGANLWGANLEGAKILTVEQLATVKTLYDAPLDPPLREQIQRQYPHLLEKPQDQTWRPSIEKIWLKRETPRDQENRP
jgi:hypothetical protein